jgi:para-aminobenzoate synthetase component 1
MIRFIEQTPTGLIFKSGGGITAFSHVEDEYKELLQKIYLPITEANVMSGP